MLILENVKKRPGKSYAMFNKNKPVPLSHVKLIISQLAKFHGMWLKYRLLNKSGRLAAAEKQGGSGLATHILFPFYENSLICLEGKSMTPHRRNTILFRSSQHLPRLRLGPSKGFLR